MKTIHQRLVSLVLIGIAISSSAGVRGETDDLEPFDDSDINDAPDVYVKLEEVPPAAAKALSAEAEGVAFSEVEFDTDTGVPQYALEWERDGRVMEATVGIEGDLVKRDEKWAFAEIPQSLQRIADGFFPPGARLQVEHTQQVSYRIVDNIGGESRLLDLSPAGRILSAQGFEGLEASAPIEDDEPKPIDSSYLIYRRIGINELPELVRKHLLQQSVPLESYEVTQREMAIGHSTYAIRWSAGIRDFELHVSHVGEELHQSQTISREELPSGVRGVLSLHWQPGTEVITRVHTFTYDLDAEGTNPPYRLILEPGGRILRASGSPHPLAAAPQIRMEESAIVVTQQGLPGFPLPRLEVSSTLASDSWKEVHLSPGSDDQWEARLAPESGPFFRVRHDRE